VEQKPPPAAGVYGGHPRSRLGKKSNKKYKYK
jgi:hypothetical protein